MQALIDINQLEPLMAGITQQNFPWLASGCISARQITDSLHTFENREGQVIQVIGFFSNCGVNIFGMLLLSKISLLSGIHGRRPLSSFYLSASCLD